MDFQKMMYDLPELYDLLKHKLEILAMISLGWFLTLFLSVMDSTAAVSIIDCFFISGVKVSIAYFTSNYYKLVPDIILLA